MTGNSSAFNDGVWVRVPGQVGHANCYYAPASASLFYIRTRADGNPLDAKKGLSLLTAAKLANIKIGVEFIPDSLSSDFWGYGTSKCEIHRIVLM